jgi:hypothetical protein
MTSHETTTETQRTVTPNCCDENGLGAALDSAMDTPAELAELAEIDENLLRAELSPAQRAAAVARRKELWEALHPETGRIPPTLGGRGNSSFSSDTEKATGESKRRLNEHLSRADALGPDLHAVVGTSLDKGVELDALKELSPEERRKLIDASCTRGHASPSECSQCRARVAC